MSLAQKSPPEQHHRRTRWQIRVQYACRRFWKSLRLLQVRTWRRWLIRFYYRHLDAAPPPSMITLRLTHHCNLRCVQCGQWGDKGVFSASGHSPFPREMSTRQWKAFIARVSSTCPHIYFFGGEPFLRRDCLELIRFATSRRMVTSVNTNGNFLTGKGRDIIASGLDHVLVSLDGPREVNNQIRVGKLDVYKAVVEGISELVAARKEQRSPYPLIELLMTLTETNQDHILETAELALGLGVDYFAVQFGIFTTPELAKESSDQFAHEFGVVPRFYHGFVRDVSGMRPDRIAGQLKKVRQLWKSRYKQYPPVEFDENDYYRTPERPLVDGPCTVPWAVMQILPNGDVGYCSDFPDLVAGNVGTHDPLVLWNNPTSRAWRRRIRTRGIFSAESRCCDYYLQ